MDLFMIVMPAVCWWIVVTAVSAILATDGGWEKISAAYEVLTADWAVGEFIYMIYDRGLKKICEWRVAKIVYMISDWGLQKIEYMISEWGLKKIAYIISDWGQGKNVNMDSAVVWVMIIYTVITLDSESKIMAYQVFTMACCMTLLELFVGALEIPPAPNSKTRPVQSNHLNPKSDVAAVESPVLIDESTQDTKPKCLIPVLVGEKKVLIEESTQATKLKCLIPVLLGAKQVLIDESTQATKPNCHIRVLLGENKGVVATIISEKEEGKSIKQKEDYASKNDDQRKWKCKDNVVDNGWEIIEKSEWLHEWSN